jgi:hypothetical protein
VPLVLVGQKVSLSNNGSDCIRVLDATRAAYLAQVFNVSIEFHADDEKTSISIRGFSAANDLAKSFLRVTLDLE